LAVLPAPVERAPLASHVPSSEARVDRTAVEPIVEPAAVAIVATTGSAPAVSIASLLFVVWMLGVCWRVASSVREWQWLRRVRRSSSPSASHFLLELLAEEASRMRIARLPLLCVSSKDEGPLLTGVVRPMVLLPGGAEATFNERELRIMLAHELAHLKRRDLLWNWLPTLVGWVFFFHPLVWLLTRRWCEAQEAACDELLIQSRVAAPADYGRLLVKLGRCLPLEPAPPLAAAGVLGTYRELERRIQAMACVRPFSLGRLLAASVALVLVAVPATIPWRLVAQENQPAAQQAAAPGTIPGKIYVQAHLEYSTEFGVKEEYNGIIAVDPNTGDWTKVGEFGHRFQLSPDGKRCVYCKFRPRDKQADATQHIDDVYVANIDGSAAERIAENALIPRWSPDGTEVLYFEGKDAPNAGWHGPTRVYNLATKQSRKLPIPETDEVDDWSRQGNWLVTVSDRHEPHGRGYQLYVMHPDGTDERKLTDGALNCYPKFSNDGKRVVYDRSKGLGSLWVVDVDGSNPKQVMIEADNGAGSPDGGCWSPDDKWLAVKVFDWQTQLDETGKKRKIDKWGDGNERIEILAPDGTNRRALKLTDVTKVNWLSHPEWQ
jgi:beta-lactamase regulating signal transducer with metallopeptidase domain